VIDAGSSGTRLRIFHWREVGRDELPQMREHRPKSEHDADLLRRRPGLSSFATKPLLAAQQILALLDQARRWIPVPQHSSTPLYLKATAGLRLVPPAQSKEILDTLRIVLSNSSVCPFRFAGARVITGEEEALFGWLSINALLGVLQGPPERRVGWLDLGGASAQMAAELSTPPPHDAPDAASVQQVHLPHETIYLFRISHLRFGREEAFRRSCRSLLRASESVDRDGATVRHAHPCLTLGDEISVWMTSPTNTHARREWVFYGEGNAPRCASLISTLLPEAVPCTAWSEGCSAMAVSPTRSFYGAGNYFYTAKQLEHSRSGVRVAGSLNVSAADYWRHAHHMCSQTWNETKAAWNESEWKHVRYGCFSGLYISEVTSQCYCLFLHQAPHLFGLSNSMSSALAIVYSCYSLAMACHLRQSWYLSRAPLMARLLIGLSVRGE